MLKILPSFVININQQHININLSTLKKVLTLGHERWEHKKMRHEVCSFEDIISNYNTDVKKIIVQDNIKK